ncbi:hypothetical protein DSO57_1002536 [Entomophthora muscae]|uniref:Uncharacterized protein n=1 Tax=Entomophthora muscae TaxID=34485 RepID=A0ACC2T8K4_9FUNG|nr:hypothetical protein DSO57_1002536 [Entomophthora muscae]
MKVFGACFTLASVLSLGPCPNPRTESCLSAGSPKMPCKAANCPPCWIQQDANNWACYNKSSTPNGPAKCPDWQGVIDITAPPSNCA